MTEPETNETAAVPAETTGEAGAPSKKWYVVTTYSGYENKVKTALQERIRQFKMDEKFGEVLIPSETVTESAKDGKQRVKTCLLYTSPSPRDRTRSRMPSSA